MAYDDTNWVAYMSPEIRAQRAKMYESLGMGGTVNWATDLEQFNDAPKGLDSWAGLILEAKSGVITPRGAGSRRGNWTKIGCDSEYYREIPYWSPMTRWEKLGAADAWSDMYAKFKSALVADAALVIDNTLPDLENTFAPVPPKKDDSWLNTILGLIALGVPTVGGKFFDDVLAGIPAMAAKTDASRDHHKGVLNAILTSPVTIATNLKGDWDAKDWKPEKQAEFSKYMGQSLKAWEYIFTTDLRDLFDGSDKSIERLTAMIADGRLLDGVPEDIPYPKNTKRNDKETEATDAQKKSVEDSFLTTFWAYSIPAVWQVSGHHLFIIDTGRTCDDKDSDKYTKDLNAFSSPKGVEELDGKAWNGLKVEDIITGSVKTYKQNGNENGGGKADPKDPGTFDALKKMDITTPGFMHLPVCSETLARKSLENADTTDATRNKEGFPYNNDNGKSYCTTSKTIYIEETTSGSPLIEDCLAIVKNIEGTSRSWFKPIEWQFGILNFGTCTFGIEGKGRKGNIDEYVGAQDVVDIIRYASKHWGYGTGKMQGKGAMQCDGNIKKQEVHWTIYKKYG
ncbi:uncharacterized protein N7487_006883 [Penicillium crustosum]|uniref:uncharacterized protein n=1 Tax=Penicillium crustosum TaxID=36656 RepID=UPI0023A69509|nr:uncharacterized protein N7487_006883 [Penicillium crustosum]KAJ5412524.1 hypothetical protein N7487_006883 [Penicillium crustosum]